MEKLNQHFKYVSKEIMLSLNMTKFIWVNSVHGGKETVFFFIVFLIHKFKPWLLTQSKTSKT